MLRSESNPAFRLFAPASLALAFLAIAFAISPAHAAWPHDPNNGNLQLTTLASDQDNSVIAPDGAGGMMIAWRDFRGGVTHDIYAQRVNAAGVPQWTANGVLLCTVAGDKNEPVIVSDGSGGAVVAWRDYRSGTNNDVYAQRVNAAGSLLWATGGIALCTAAFDQVSPVIVADGAGGAIVAWYDYRSGTNYDIYAQHVTAVGTAAWAANGVALCTAANDQLLPKAVSDGAGGAIVTWYDRRSVTTSHIYAQRVNAGGAVQWAANGVAVCFVTNEDYPSIVSDGAGGAIVAWRDGRGASIDVYAQRLNAAGSPQWTTNGVAVCTNAAEQRSPMIDSDGSGGAIVAWQDYRNGSSDIYAQRMNSAGTPVWTADGVALSNANNGQEDPQVLADGVGGAIVAWHDLRSNVYWDVYAQRVNSAGSTLWAYDGAPISIAANDQVFPNLISDGNGGAFITWYDHRNGNYDIYAQRIEQFGYLGSPEPASTGVRDVPNDQGGEVKVSWNASYLDAQPYSQIDAYWILRSAPPNVVAEARARGARVNSDLSIEPEPGVRTFLALPNQATSFSWEYIASQPPFHVTNYSYVAPTTSDSLAAGNPRTAFMIMARSYNGGQYWFSAPDSGYSVDNIPPSAPAPFTAAYEAGATNLHWSQNPDADLAGYRLYRGSSSGFVPGPGNLISAQPDTGFADVGPAGSYYKLSAIDAHGNESLYATLGPNGTLDASAPQAPLMFLAAPEPNPARGDGAAFRFGLPAESSVALTLFDQQGRRVCDVARATYPAGSHSVRWDGRDAAGHPVPPGLYFLRLKVASRTLQARLVLVR